MCACFLPLNFKASFKVFFVLSRVSSFIMPRFKSDVHFLMTYNFRNILIKFFTVTIGFIPLVKLTVIQQEQELSSKEIGDLLRNDFIIPDVIYNDPKHRMKVYFEDNGDIYHLNYGNLITPQQARRQPNVQWPVEPAEPMEEEVTYTLFCISSDHPSREETWGHWVHWQHVNIQGCNLSTGHEINQYTGPEPSETSGVHRYVFLVFKENPHFPVRLNKSDDSDEMRMFTERRDFNTDNFIRHFNLGIPAWASNFFTSRFEQLPSNKQ